MPPSLWLGSGAAFGSAASPRNYPPAISRQTARAPAAPPPALRADRKSYSNPGGKGAGPGPSQGEGLLSREDTAPRQRVVSLPQRFVPNSTSALSWALAPWAFGPVPRPRGTSRRRCPCSEPVPWGSPGGWRGLTGELVPPWGRLAPKGRTFRRKSSAPCPLLEGGGPPQRARDP